MEKVKQLAKSQPEAGIAAALNQEGLFSATGKTFSTFMIKWLRYKHSIPGPELKRKDELTVQEVAHKFKVDPGVVYYWIKQGVLTARRITRGSPCWITFHDEKERELSEWIRTSPRIEHK